MTIINKLLVRILHKNVCYILILGTFFLGWYFMLSPTSTVEAHATLLEMEPTENVVTEESPSTLTLTFNEPIEHDLALVTIYDSNATPVFTGNPDEENAKSSQLEFSPSELRDGTYTVKWDVVSADGHPVDGSYAFAVGEATEGGVKTIQGDNQSESGIILARVVPEGLLLLGAGLFWFAWLAERRNFPTLHTLWTKGRAIAAILLILGTIAEFIAYSFSLPPGIMEVILNGRWELLGQFPFILMLFAQSLCILLLLIPDMMRGWYLAVWALLAVIPAFGGHVWGMEEPLTALIPRVFHQLSIAFWLGALGYIVLLVIWQKKKGAVVDWKTFRPFFVYKMLVAASLVVLSGLVMVYMQAGITAVFTDWKTWSGVLLAKVFLTFIMGLFAIYQTLKWKKRQTFTTVRLIRVEWIIGLAVLILGVWLSQISYPIAVENYDETLISDHVEADVYIKELKTGDRTMEVHVDELDGEKPESVEAKVTMPQHDMGSEDVIAEEADNGGYRVELPFSMSGSWRLELTARYPDHEKVEWQDDIYVAGEEN